MIKAVMIGTAGHFSYAFSAICDGTKAKIVAISADPERHLNYEFAERQYVPIYDDYKLMFDETKPNLAIINPQFKFISECAAESLRRGINIFCEKPISITYDGLEKIIKASKSGKARICAMMGMRNEAPFYSLKKIIDDGEIGDIRLIHAQKSYILGERPEFYRKRDTFGGLIPWVGSHPIDMIYWLTGRKKYKSVTANHSKLNNRNHGELEATAAILFEIQDDITATVNLDYLRPNGSASHGDDRIRIMSSNGWAEIVNNSLYINGKRIETNTPEGNIFHDFIRELSGGVECSITNEDSIYIAKICLKARDAADNCTKIKLD